MIRVSILYPRAEGTNFDIDYYVSKHMAIVQRELGDALKGCGVDEGMGGDNPSPYHAIGYLMFDSVNDFFAGMAGATETQGDMGNFTNTTPQLQISEIRL